MQTPFHQSRYYRDLLESYTRRYVAFLVNATIEPDVSSLIDDRDIVRCRRDAEKRAALVSEQYRIESFFNG